MEQAEVPIVNVKEQKTINVQMELIPDSFFALKDGRIGVAIAPHQFKLFDPNNNYHCDISRDEKSKKFLPSNGVSLPNGDFICQKYFSESLTFVQFGQNSLNIIHTIEKTHGYLGPNAIRVISDESLVTCGDDGTIKIWKGTRPYSSTPLHVIENPNKGQVLNVLHYPKLDALLSISTNSDPKYPDITSYVVRKWDLKTFTCLGEYLDIMEGLLIPVGDITALWGGYIIDVNTMKMNKDDSKTKEFYPRTLRVGDYLLFAEKDGKIARYDCNTFEKKKIYQTTHKANVREIIQVNETTLATRTEMDMEIKFWKVKDFLN